MSITAKDLKTAKKFYEIFIRNYGDYFDELELIEGITTVKKAGLVNPKTLETKKLTDL